MGELLLMKKKFSFLVMSYHTINFFRPIIKELIRRGNEVQILAIYELPYGAKEDKFNTHRVQWQKFELSRLEKFNPDTVVIFNGFFRPIHAASQYIAQRWTTLYAEVAWFTQNEYIYIDKDIHGNSAIAQWSDYYHHQSKGKIDWEKGNEVLNDLWEKYEPGPKPVELEDGMLNVVVPLQLERDTSILYASHTFKDMGSLVGFIYKACKESLHKVNLIVKTHPKLKTDDLEEHFKPDQFPGIKFVKDTPSTMNDYAAHCDAVIGINSTSIIEAHVHERHVYQMGSNVFKRMPDRADIKEIHAFLDRVAAGEEARYIEQTRSNLLYLLANQIDYKKPAPWVYDKLLSPDPRAFRPRPPEATYE